MPSYLDLAVLGIVLVSALLALLRGFTREVLAIFSWVAAGGIAYLEFRGPHFLDYIRPYIAKEMVAKAVDTAGVFFVALFIISIVTVKLSDVILDSKIGALDRTLGFIFGVARGFLIAVVTFVFYAWLVPDANQPMWVKTARTKPILESTGDKLRDFVPQDIEQVIAEWKPKKGAPVNEEPPPESSDMDSAKPDEPAPAPEKKSEAPAPNAAAAAQPQPARRAR
jgi:membrane protein required for colicin V production